MTNSTSVWTRMLRRWASRSRSRRPPTPGPRQPRLGLLTFEDRLAPAIVTWIGGPGDWNTAANWEDQSTHANRVPGATDDAVIPGTVSFTGGTGVVASLTVGGKLSVTGGELYVNGNVGGGGTVEIAGGSFTPNGLGWVNSTTINLNSGRLDLGGTFTAGSVGRVNRVGGTSGTVGIIGTLTGDLALDATTGPWNVGGRVNGSVVPGTIQNGTVTTADGVSLGLEYGTLSNVTVNGAAATTGGNAAAFISGSLTLNGTLAINPGGKVVFDGLAGSTQQVGGVGTISMLGNGGTVSNFAGMEQSGGAHTVAFGSGINTVVLGTFNTVGGGGPAGAWTTGGKWTVPSGYRLDFSAGSFNNLAGGVWESTGGMLNVGGQWSNAGTIRLDGGTVNLGGTFRGADIGTISRTTGTVNITGTASGGLTLGASTGSLNLVGGTVDGGAIETADGTELRLPAFSPADTLSNVTINGSVVVSDFGGGGAGRAVVNVLGDLTVNGTFTLGTLDAINFIASAGATQTVSGGGTIVLRGSAELNQGGASHTIAFGAPADSPGGRPRLSAVGNNTSVGANGLSGTWTNRGTWSAASGGGLGLTTGTFINLGDGTWAAAGGALTIQASSWTNDGRITVDSGTATAVTAPTNLSAGTLTGGIWQVLANGLLRLPTAIATNAATLILDGPSAKILVGPAGTSSALSALTTNAAAGSLSLQNGASVVPLADFTNVGSIAVGAGSSFGVTQGSPPTSGLVGLWKGDGNTDNTVTGSPGSAPGGVSYAAGVAGQAFVLDGSGQYVGIADAAPVRPTDLSISCWVNFAALPTGSSVYSIFGKAVGSGDEDSYAVWYANGQLRAYVNGSVGAAPFLAYTWAPALGSWQHVAFTFDDAGDTFRLYVNGAVVASGTTTRSIGYDSHEVQIGADTTGGSPSYPFKGAIDEVRLYNRSLTASEILAVYRYEAAHAIVQTGGSLALAGGTLGGTSVSIQAGSLSGVGTVEAPVTNAGTVSPGSPIGTLAVNGDFTQSSSGRLALAIGGTAAGSQYDRLAVSGQATLDGTLDVALANGFGPAAGQQFVPVTFGGGSGDFATANLPAFAGAPVFAEVVTGTRVTLTSRLSTPDLVAVDVQLPGPLAQGNDAHVGYTVRDDRVDAPGGWTDRVFLSLDTTLDATDVPLGDAARAADVTAGQSYSGTVTAAVPAVPAGRYYLLLDADAGGTVPDQDRANNVLASAGTIPVNLDERPLAVNQPTVGNIETGNSMDRWTFAGMAGQAVNLVVLNTAAPNGVKFTLRGPGGFVGFSGLTAGSDVVTLTATGTYTLEVSSDGGATGAYSFRVNEAVAAALALGVPYSGSLPGSGFSQLFRLDVTQPAPLKVRLAGGDPAGRMSVYAKVGSLPSRAVNDFRAAAPAASQALDIPLAAPGTLYLLVYGDGLAGASDFTLEVDSTSTSVDKVTPNSFAAGQTDATVAVQGLGFVPGTRVELVPAAGAAIAATSVGVDRTSQLSATFDLTTAPVGDYGVRVTLPGGASDTLANAFHVVAGGSGRLETRLLLPAFLGRHAPATLIVEYRNAGTAAMPAPILVLQSADPDDSDRPLLTLDPSLVGQGLWTSALPPGLAHSQQIYASGAAPGLLLPGERIQVPVYYAGLQQPWDGSDGQVELAIGVHEAGDTSAINWSAGGDVPKPDWLTDEEWEVARANLHAQIGETWGDYVGMLSKNAAYLKRFGQDTRDVSRLYGFEVRKAVGLDAVGTIASAVDSAVAAPGLSLVLGRTFGNSIQSRRATGPFGYGWDASWTTTLLDLPDGSVQVADSPDSSRRFLPDVRHPGAYFSGKGDPGVLRRVASNAFELTETNGLVTRYKFGQGVEAVQGGGVQFNRYVLDYVQDINGNRVTAQYDQPVVGRVTRLTHSSGAWVALTYNLDDRVTGMTDSSGNTTTFTYDPSFRRLLGATGPAGTTTYTYSGMAAGELLTAVTGPDGLTQHFEYDGRGRLAASYVGGNVQRVDFNYGENGQVTATDQAGVSVTSYFDADGLLVRSEDSLGHYVVYEYNDNRQLVKTTDDLGRSTSYTRCDCGRPKTITDVYGRTILSFTLGGPHNAPTAFTDANGNVTRYTYDAVGNVTDVTYPDGTAEHATYDADGNLDVTTNRRGQVVDRTTNAAGQVTFELWSDGTHRSYTYDSRGRLHTATDIQQGTTTLDYDAADRLTQVTYPNGRWLKYAYDAAGRRTRIEDQTGFATNYAYDAAGRLHELTDRNNQRVVLYAYDAAGRLAREDKGNGTYTVYGYDAAGRETSIVHHAPNGDINSKFLYTYDAAGRRHTQTTVDGTWTYSYDLVDQLTRAVFVSTNPAIPNQDLNYEFDALGNRTRTVLNGATTTYTANGMNQYTSAGGTTFQYDADGNLTRESGPDGVKEYTYDQQNRLLRVQTPEGVWQYEYDILGNRTAVVKNGVRTEYLIDPLGLGNVVGEYDVSGSEVAGYAQGYGLEGSNRDGDWGFYDFDALGSTSGLSGSSGGYVDQYAYDPWGSTLNRNETVTNPFKFVGQAGVMDDGGGLQFMRARYYSSSGGRFSNGDPVGLGGGINLYAYSANSPSLYVDPEGTSPTWLGKALDIARIIFTVANGPSDTSGMSSTVSKPIQQVVEEAASQATKDQAGRAAARRAGSAGFTEVGALIDGAAFTAVAAGSAFIFYQIGAGVIFHEIGKLPPCLPGIPVTWQNCDPSLPFKLDPYSPKPQPPTTASTQFKLFVRQTFDPNEKLAASGLGSQAFIADGTTIPYRINYENLGPGSDPVPAHPATAPVQRVDVTDQLSTLLDWDTLQFTELGFGDTVVAIPAGRTNFFTTVGTTYNGKFFNVEVELTFDRDSGLVRAAFQAVDPRTGLPPDVLTGFLPPEDGTGRGKGHFAFTVKPKAGLPTGTELRNVADIRFDLQQVIATNQVDPQNPAAGTSPAKEALNTIDAGAPTSSVAPLPAVTGTATFPVSWAGQDDAGGSGVSVYDVFVSVDGGPFTPWLTGADATAATYTGEDNRAYAFYSVATDHVGLRQPAPAQAQAFTRLDVNDPPALSAVPDRTVTAGQVLTVTPVASDPDGAAGLVYNLADGAPAFASVDPATGVITVAPPAGTAGDFPVTVTVTDPGGLSAARSFTVTVRASGTPVASVNPLPAVLLAPTFPVSWDGYEPGGAGYAGTDVYVATDGGPYARWQANTRAWSATFFGQRGHRYDFVAVGRDRDGNVQPFPAGPQASVAIPAAPTAVADAFAAPAGRPVTGNLLANDANPAPARRLTAVLVSDVDPAQGSLKFSPTGVFTFTPKAGWAGRASFTYRLKDPTGRESNTARVDLAASLVGFRFTQVYALEGKATAVLTVDLWSPATAPVTVDYTVAPQTARPRGEDFALVSGSLTFAAGEKTKTIPIALTNDLLDEANETLQVWLTGTTGPAVVGKNRTATVTIVDDDPTPKVSFRAKASAGTEDQSPALEVVLTAPSGRPVTVKYQLAGGTAKAGADFTFTPGLLNFAPGETSKTIPITVVNDTQDEPDETVKVLLTTPVNAVAGPAMLHTYSIKSDDPVRTVGFDAAEVQAGEAAGTVQLTVRLSAPAPLFPVTVAYAVEAGGTAAAGRDFVLGAGTLTFRPGEAQKTVLVRVLNDNLDEAAETVRIRLSRPTNAVLGPTDLLTLTIQDDDPT